MSLQLFQKIHQSRRGKGQAMVEFALVFPIFLLLVLGVIELGHLIFIYSSVYVSSREAARYGAAAGFSGAGMPYYQDCTGMRDAAQRVGAYGGVTNVSLAPGNIDAPNTTGVAIQMIKNGSNTPVDYTTCPDLDVKVGDRIRVTTQVYYQPIVPLVPFPSFAVSHTSTRTILKNVDLEKVDPGSPPVADTYGVDLSVADNSLLGAQGTQVTYDLSIRNTGSIFDTYTLTLSGNSWTTTLDSPVSVAPGATLVRQVVVTVPPNAPHGASDMVLITATSIGDPGLPPASDNQALITSAPTYGVNLATPDDSKGGVANTTVTYDLTITNTGNIDDTYTLTASGNLWPTAVPNSIAVSAGATVSFTAVVSVPGDYAGVTSDTVTITAVSDGDPISPAVSDTQTLTTRAPYYGVQVSTWNSKLSGRPGDTVTYTIHVYNTGNVPDTYDITLSGSTWPTKTDLSVDVADGSSKDVLVTVGIPSTATHGSTDTVTFTVVSRGAPDKSTATASLTLTTKALAFSVSLSAAPGTYQMGAPGTTVTYNLSVKNTGTANDTYTLILSGNVWPTTLNGSVSVAAGATVVLPVVVSIPATVANGARDRVTVTAISTNDPLTPPASASITLTTSVPRYGVRLTLTVPDDSLSGAPGDPITYYLTIQNTGNVKDTFNITLSGNNWPTSVVPTSVTLNPNESMTNIVVTVNIPGTALHNETDVVTVTAYSGDALAPHATASLTLSTTATRICPYAGSLGLGNKSINLLLYNNGTGAEDVSIEQIIVNWYMNTDTQSLDYISYLGRKIMDTDVPGSLLDPTYPYITSTFPAQGAWIGDATTRNLPQGASNYGLNIYFGVNIDTTKTHSIEIRFSNGCYISR
ncbi:protein containg conserved repeat domain [Longilinea arvoryzae]|uniref:Protein containg conserved repeat domain n=1 Tax=Longilinea arvoryzae TaxID=360412 RepID=A0A0S7BKL0_9CHLR|nr:FixG Ig-like domain-containing protein [Longilinea arvoryzae]GAP15648.1 protein containg conserved repeat domain [Longilinea arvoryzae]